MPNALITHVVNRDCAVCAAMASSSVVTANTGTLGLVARIVCRTAAASDAGGTVARSTSDACAARSRNGKYRSGSAVGFSGRPRYFTSAATPTIDSHGAVPVKRPILIRLPIGSWPGQKRLATRSLTITALDEGTASDGRNVRPCRI